MNRTVARCLYGVLFAGGITLLGATAANAADTSGDDGVLSGTLVDTVVSIPVTVGGNAVSVLGDSDATNTAPAAASVPTSPAGTTSGNDAVASGSQVAGVVSVPITIGGNAVSAVGDSASSGASAPAVVATAAPVADPSPATTSGDDSIAGGSQVLPNVTAPVTIGGNAISVLGDSSSKSSTTGTATDAGSPIGSSITSGDDSVAGGTQVAPVVTAPVSVGGNAISVVGDSSSTSSTTSGAVVPVGTTSAGSTTSGDDGVASGSQVLPVVTVPVTAGGNAVSVIGDSSSTGSATDTSSPVVGSKGSTTSGDDGVLSGTQVTPVINVPIDLGGNGVSVIGDSSTGTTPAEPAAPGIPAIPGTPTTPTAPATPTNPATPTSPAFPTDPSDVSGEGVSNVGTEAGTAAEVNGQISAEVAASADPQLAETGTDTAGLLLRLAALLLLAGAAIVLFGRKRAAQRI